MPLESLYPVICDHVALVVVVTDAEGIIRYVNRYGLEALGRTAGQMRGERIESYLYGADGRRTWSDLRQRLLMAGTCDARANLALADGREMVCELHGFAPRQPVEGESCVVLVFRDVTQELQSARHIEEKNLLLAKMNSELVRSNAELRRASELKSNFLSIASHELKTPLTSIKGYSDIIIDTMKERLEPGIFSMVSSISRAADRLHRVVNNILDVTRIERGKLRLSPEELSLETLVRECIEEVAQLGVKRGIVFACTCSADLPPFHGDRSRMQQVFANLLGNAVKFSPDNATVEVSVRLQDPEHFHITVRDHGVGIPAEEQQRIFTPFYKAGSITKHSTDAIKFMGGGTGLGLSIVKGVVERHGGSILVESSGMREGTFPGSAFHIVLPLRSTIRWDDDGSREAAARDTALAHEDAGGLPVVLLADSDGEVVEAVRMALDGAFEVITAADGGNALAMAFEHRPALVLLERHLPVMDGVRVCQVLRSQDETAATPVAFLSGEASSEEMQRCYAVGADDYIVKPFGSRELAGKVRQLLTRRSVSRPPV